MYKSWHPNEGSNLHYRPRESQLPQEMVQLEADLRATDFPQVYNERERESLWGISAMDNKAHVPESYLHTCVIMTHVQCSAFNWPCRVILHIVTVCSDDTIVHVY